jgi:photosystem II stability/assembly factor-like uncharacterized protein
MTCAILMAFTMSHPLVQPGQWVDINQTTAALRSVFMLSPTVGWAVGDSGTILFWNGHEWSLVQSPTTLNLYSVFFPDVSNPNDGWIVGQSDGIFPAILHWDGVSWVKLDTTSGISWAAAQVGALNGLFFLSPSDGWAVGVGTTTQPGVVTNIVHWSGSWGAGGSWTIKATPAAALPFDLFSVQVLSNTATPVGGYAVGGNPGAGIILFWDGANWNWYPGAVPTAVLRSVWMMSPTDAWAVGDGVAMNPVAIRLTGTTWGGPMSLSALGIRNLYSVVAIDTNNAYAVGSLNSAGAADIIKFSTPSWTAVTSPATVDLFSVCRVPGPMPGSSDIWSVGDWGTILRNTAGTWKVLTSPVGAGDLMVPPPPPLPPNVFSLHFTAPNNGWAVGEQGTIIKYDGVEWSTYQTAPLVSNDLHSVYTISPIDGWAVGAHGTILRLTSSGWGVVAQCPGPTCLQDVILRSVFELTTGEAWAVGDASNGGLGPATILHWVPPGPWSQVPSNTPSPAYLNSAFFLSDGSEGWAVGYQTLPSTVIDHWKNGVWTAVTYNPLIPGTLMLDSVFIVNNNPSNVWVTGTSSGVGGIGGIVLHYDGTIWAPSPINQPGLTDWTTVSFVPGSTNDGWIVGGQAVTHGGGQTLHWDGTTWTDIPLVPRPFGIPPLGFPEFTSVQMLSANDGWAVGYLGHIIRLGPQPFVTTTITLTSTSIISTSTTSTSTTSTVTTPASTWGVPGFPIESILAGLLGGLAAIAVIRRQHRLRISAK